MNGFLPSGNCMQNDPRLSVPREILTYTGKKISAL
jgi:hypothetical protein